LGKEFVRHQDYSESTAVAIDNEIKRLVGQAYQRSQELITKHRPVLDRIAQALLEREVLEGEEVYRLVSEFTGVPVEQLRGPGRPSPAVAAS